MKPRLALTEFVSHKTLVRMREGKAIVTPATGAAARAGHVQWSEGVRGRLGRAEKRKDRGILFALDYPL